MFDNESHKLQLYENHREELIPWFSTEKHVLFTYSGTDILLIAVISNQHQDFGGTVSA